MIPYERTTNVVYETRVVYVYDNARKLMDVGVSETVENVTVLT